MARIRTRIRATVMSRLSRRTAWQTPGMPAREPRDSEPDQPSLELPSLSGWRRKRRARGQESSATPVAPPSGSPAAAPEPPTVADPPPITPQPTPEPEPTPEPTDAPVAPPSGAPATAPEPPTVVDAPPPAPEPEPDDEDEEPRRRAPRVRRPGGLPTVVVVGALVGLAVVGLTWAALQACRQVQGTPSCGTAGYPLLALVLALSVVVGSVLLRLALVPDPVSTSVLGVGLAAVILLLTLVGHLEQPAMVVVVPLISALTFAAAHWISRSATEPDER